ncbi:uncharacterized protein LOC130814783 [Amaranthus tricolor]|uniref:uncharacterized protein LOC130814783 n=1 Tax=Amaranthus tricolor TaxID=29722 RepID=UPI00258A3067|nr:uncharacterized protein LOC130814783 [Amaranthus tricolor]
MASKDKESAVLLGEESQITRKTSKKDLEARVAKLEISLGDALDDITKLEERVGALEDKEDEVAQSLVNQVLRSEMGAIRDSLGGELQAVKELVESLKGDITLCKAAVAGGAIVREGPKMKIPEPPKYHGKRDARELDNFLWSIERYFDAMRVDDDSSKINTTTMYLGDDAILWWRRRESDIKKRTFTINTWEEFKADFKRQFYPENVEEVAMKKLRGLKHTSTIKEYVKQFSSLMLEVTELPEKEQLLYFMDGLQRWAEQELKRRNVQTLAEAIAAAESLIEYKQDSKKDKSNKKGGDKGKGGGAKLTKDRGNGGGKPFEKKDKGKSDSDGKFKNRDCFLYGGPHFARECPQRQKLNAMVAAHEQDSGKEV